MTTKMKTCPLCPRRTFGSISGLRRHTMFAHEGSTNGKSLKELQTFRCSLLPKCKRTYRDPQSLSDHANFDHLGLKNYACPVCEARFGRNYQVLIHQIKSPRCRTEKQASEISSGGGGSSEAKSSSIAQNIAVTEREASVSTALAKPETPRPLYAFNSGGSRRAITILPTSKALLQSNPGRQNHVVGLNRQRALKEVNATRVKNASGKPATGQSGKKVECDDIKMDSGKSLAQKRKQNVNAPVAPKKVKMSAAANPSILGYLESVPEMSQHSSSIGNVNSVQEACDIEESTGEYADVECIEDYPTQTNNSNKRDSAQNNAQMISEKDEVEILIDEVMHLAPINRRDTTNHEHNSQTQTKTGNDNSTLEHSQPQPQAGTLKHEFNEQTANGDSPNTSEIIKCFQSDAVIFKMSSVELDAEVELWKSQKQLLEQSEKKMKKELAYVTVLKDQTDLALDTIRLHKRAGRCDLTKSELDTAEQSELARLKSMTQTEEQLSTTLKFVALDMRKIDVYLRKLDLALN